MGSSNTLHPFLLHLLPFCGVLSRSVICHEKENHRVEHRQMPSKPVVRGSLQTGDFAVFMRTAHLDKLTAGH